MPKRNGACALEFSQDLVISCTEHLLIRVGERNPELLQDRGTVPFPSHPSLSLT